MQKGEGEGTNSLAGFCKQGNALVSARGLVPAVQYVPDR